MANVQIFNLSVSVKYSCVKGRDMACSSKHLFAKDHCGCFPSEAFHCRVVEMIADLFEAVICHFSDVAIA